MKQYNDKIVASVKVIGDGWRDSPYYENVEQQLGAFWREGSPFAEMFGYLDLSHVVELACGHGRHSDQIKNRSGEITLMDINQSNIDHCKLRFAGYDNISVQINNGLDFYPLSDESVSSVFCYDAMVHFDHRSVFSYLEDFARIAKKGAYGLFHHSNNNNPFFTHYGQNPHSRNFMTKELFARYALDNGLKVIKQRVIGWGGGDKFVADLDCLTLIQK